MKKNFGENCKFIIKYAYFKNCCKKQKSSYDDVFSNKCNYLKCPLIKSNLDDIKTLK